MKKLAITIAAVFATLNIFAQGTVNFSNVGLNPTAPPYVYDNTGAAQVRAAAGTTFSVALYWSPQVAGVSTPPDPGTFIAVGQSIHIAAPGLPISLQAGLYSGGTVTIPGIAPPGGMGWFQVRAWETAFGSTYESAVAAGSPYGVSNEIDIGSGNPTITPPTPQTQLTGISAIHIGVVPEPAILGLGLLGGAALLLLRRRK